MLREVWLNIEVEKVDMHEGITVKALLDSSVTGIFMGRKIVAKHGFRLQKLERPVMVRNVDGTNNSGGAITHQVKVNVYYKSYIERMICAVWEKQTLYWEYYSYKYTTQKSIRKQKKSR